MEWLYFNLDKLLKIGDMGDNKLLVRWQSHSNSINIEIQITKEGFCWQLLSTSKVYFSSTIKSPLFFCIAILIIVYFSYIPIQKSL